MAGRVIAFYGFKGGAGRSFLLANTAALLSALGRRVLVIDADMEAPGLGDFFDTNIKSLDLETGLLFSESRLKRGFLDLMSEVADPDFVMNFSGSLSEKIAQMLDPKATSKAMGGPPFLTEVGPFNNTVRDQPPGILYLMGAGSHRVTREDGSFSYIARLLDFDWTARVQGRGKFAFDALGEVLASGELFDDVLIDGRTGYNAASIIAIRNLATDVVMVGTSSMQSIDGMARMRPLFSAPDGDSEGLRTHLVISRMTGALPEEAHRARRAQAARIKRLLNTEYHPQNTVHELPYIEDFVTGDALFFRRSGIRDIAPVEVAAAQLDDPKLSRNEKTKIAVGNYKYRFLSFVRDIMGPEGLGQTGPKLNAKALEIAFESWAAEQRELSGVRIGFEGTSALPDEDEIRRDSEGAISRLLDGVQEYLVPSHKILDESQQPLADGREISAKNRDLTALERQFAALRLEERALVQARTVDLLTKIEGETRAGAVNDIFDAFRLAVSPNIVQGAQLTALGLLGSKRLDLSPEPRSENREGPLDRKLNQGQLVKLCSHILENSRPDNTDGLTRLAESTLSDIAQELERTHDADYSAVLRFLNLYIGAVSASNAQGDTKRKEANKAAVQLLQDTNAYLPGDLSSLRGYNVLDLMKRLANVRSEITATSACAMAQLVMRRIQDLCGTFETAADDEKGQAIVDLASWGELWAANSINGVGFADPIPANYPTSDDLAPAIALMEGVIASPEAGEETMSLRLAAYTGLAEIAVALDDAPGANSAVESLTDFAAKKVNDASKKLEGLLQSFKNCAEKISRVDLYWRLDRLDDVLRARGRDSDAGGTFNFAAYLNTVRAGQDLGLALLEDLVEFPDLPDEVTASDREEVDKIYGWWKDGDAMRFGEFQRFVEKWSSEKSATDPDTGKLSFLIAAEIEIGALEDAIASFELWSSREVRQRNSRVDGIRTYSKLTFEILRGLMNRGDLDGFQRFLRETDYLFPEIETRAGNTFFARRRLLALRYKGNGAMKAEEVGKKAESILAEGLEIARFLPCPTDASLAPLLGSSWENFGAFSGEECPSPKRADIAALILDALELIPEARPDHLSKVEKLIWGNDVRHQGGADVPVADQFLTQLEKRLRLERARLEWLRAQLGLPAALEMAREAMAADLELNGVGRAIHYPQELHEGH